MLFGLIETTSEDLQFVHRVVVQLGPRGGRRVAEIARACGAYQRRFDALPTRCPLLRDWLDRERLLLLNLGVDQLLLDRSLHFLRLRQLVLQGHSHEDAVISSVASWRLQDRAARWAALAGTALLGSWLLALGLHRGLG